MPSSHVVDALTHANTHACLSLHASTPNHTHLVHEHWQGGHALQHSRGKRRAGRLAVSPRLATRPIRPFPSAHGRRLPHLPLHLGLCLRGQAGRACWHGLVWSLCGRAGETCGSWSHHWCDRLMRSCGQQASSLEHQPPVHNHKTHLGSHGRRERAARERHHLLLPPTSGVLPKPACMCTCVCLCICMHLHVHTKVHVPVHVCTRVCCAARVRA